MAADRASLIELQTVYSVADAYILMETAVIDSYNRRISDKNRSR